MKEKTVTLKPYDREVSDNVFSVLFYGSDYSTEEGLMEIPSASYQLISSALELIRWDLRDSKDRDVINKAVGIVDYLRDKQKEREYNRRMEAKNNA